MTDNAAEASKKVRQLDVAQFYAHLGKLHSHFVNNRSFWGDASCLSLHRGQPHDYKPNVHIRSVVLQQCLFGHEISETILFLTKAGDCAIFSHNMGCDFLRPAVGKAPTGNPIMSLTLLASDQTEDNAENLSKLLETSGLTKNGTKITVGILARECPLNKQSGGLLTTWEETLGEQGNLVDVAPCVGVFMATKDDTELALVQISSWWSTKVLKYGFKPRMEETVNSKLRVTHKQFTDQIIEMIANPAYVKLDIPKDDHLAASHFPIVQSGDTCNFNMSAMSNGKMLSNDIIIVSLGARYNKYRSNIARTFLVDAPKIVSENYKTLLDMQGACLASMVPGKPLKSVYQAAVNFLNSNDKQHLVQYLGKSVGYAVGLDYDPLLALNSRNQLTFCVGMTFCVTVFFEGLALTDDHKASTNIKSPMKNLSKYTLVLSDTVSIVKSGKAEVLTKFPKGLKDISYSIHNEPKEESDKESPGAPSCAVKTMSPNEKKDGTSTKQQRYNDGDFKLLSRLLKDGSTEFASTFRPDDVDAFSHEVEKTLEIICLSVAHGADLERAERVMTELCNLNAILWNRAPDDTEDKKAATTLRLFINAITTPNNLERLLHMSDADSQTGRMRCMASVILCDLSKYVSFRWRMKLSDGSYYLSSLIARFCNALYDDAKMHQTNNHAMVLEGRQACHCVDEKWRCLESAMIWSTEKLDKRLDLFAQFDWPTMFQLESAFFEQLRIFHMLFQMCMAVLQVDKCNATAEAVLRKLGRCDILFGRVLRHIGDHTLSSAARFKMVLCFIVDYSDCRANPPRDELMLLSMARARTSLLESIEVGGFYDREDFTVNKALEYLDPDAREHRRTEEENRQLVFDAYSKSNFDPWKAFRDYRKLERAHHKDQLDPKMEKDGMCANCFALEVEMEGKLMWCKGCKTALYCSLQCHAEHWKKNHKHVCCKQGVARLKSTKGGSP